MESFNKKWRESGFNNQQQNSEYILKRVERNFREYAGSYLGIDNIKYEKLGLVISRKDFNDPFTDVEKSMIYRFLSLYKVKYEVKGNKIEIFI